MNRYKLTIEYDGTNYCGFQKQFDIPQKSIEEVLEKAIFSLSQENVKIIPAGRTDKGVHALGQIIHFDLNKKFENYQIVRGLNSYLTAENIAILNSETVDENFHARFNAKQRSYKYIIINRSAPLTLNKNRAWHIIKSLDIEAMREGASYLIGQHDFSSFRDAECQSSSPIKTINKIEINDNAEKIEIEISAKSFLHHMVRNIIGTLADVGKNKITPQEIKNILAAKNRTKSGANAPSCGLYFLKVEY